MNQGEELGEKLAELVEERTRHLNDEDYLTALEVVINFLRSSVVAKREEQERAEA